MLLLDSPPSWTSAQDVLAAHEAGLDAVVGASGANVALIFPRLGDGLSATGAVAGVIARTDARTGVWGSPAGEQALLNRVPHLDVDLTSREVSALTAAGISCLRSLPGGGRVVWGARTMDGADAAGSPWKYLSVRRTALFIEESVQRGTTWVGAEANTEQTWAQVGSAVSAFMHSMFEAGAFPATSIERDAYTVACGPDTMTPDEIAAGVVTVTVGFAPIRAGEFVTVNVRQATADAE